MELNRFDQLVQSLATSGSRRGLVGLLTAVPILGGFAALLGDEAPAKGRQTRRQRAGHERDLTAERRKKKKKKKCKPQSLATTCAGKCEAVTNNCQQTVNCGLCPVCHRCNSATRVCQPDPGQQGDACGGAGQICLADGSCACDAGSCGLGTVCLEGTCEDCGFIGGPCCSNNNCQPPTGAVCIDDTCEACGRDGEQCCANDTCDVGRVCLSGTCEDCGVVGQPCCAGDACLLGATCDQGTCVA